MVCLCWHPHLGKMSLMDLFHSAVKYYSSDSLKIGVCDCRAIDPSGLCSVLLIPACCPVVCDLPECPVACVFPVPQGAHLSAPQFSCCRECSMLPNKVY